MNTYGKVVIGEQLPDEGSVLLPNPDFDVTVPTVIIRESYSPAFIYRDPYVEPGDFTFKLNFAR
jgi:hypothetical protein